MFGLPTATRTDNVTSKFSLYFTSILPVNTVEFSLIAKHTMESNLANSPFLSPPADLQQQNVFLSLTEERPPATAIDAQVKAYVTRVADALREELQDNLTAVYLFGSAGYGAYEQGISDIDVYAIIEEPLEDYAPLTQKITHAAIPCPSHKLEFVLISKDNAAAQSSSIKFEMNFTTGKDISDRIILDPSAEARFWFVLDVAMGRDLGTVFYGPSPREILAGPKPELVFDCLIESLAWYRENLPITHEGVLNACRELRFVRTGRWGSKMDGCNWVLEYYNRPEIIALASHARRSKLALPQNHALDFLNFAEKEIRNSGAPASAEWTS
jgi:hypothetical protein